MPLKPGFLLRAALFYAAIWWVLARQGSGMVALGGVAVVAALLVARRVGGRGGTSLRWRRLPGFFARFVWQSIRAGIDVARRAASPNMRLQPGFVELRLELPGEGARVLVATTISLLPGTLAARLDGDRLTLHALDRRQPIEAELRHLERDVAALFGAPLPPSNARQEARQ